MTARSYDVPLRAQLDCPAAWLEQVVAALAVAGIAVDGAAPVGIGIAPGRQVSTTLDAWSVASLPHLLVAAWPWAIEVGPWAAPGLGPCARCVEAAVLDDGRTLRATPLPGPLLALAAGAAARDLGAWLRGDTPHTWLSSWRFDHEPLPRERRWQRHPYCGCGWFDTA